MNTVARGTGGWIACAAMTFLFVACYWAFHMVRYNPEDFPAKAGVERVIALIRFADWIVLLLFSAVRDYIWLPRRASYVIAHEDDGHFRVLPLLTMTGVRSKSPEGTPGEKRDTETG